MNAMGAPSLLQGILDFLGGSLNTWFGKELGGLGFNGANAMVTATVTSAWSLNSSFLPSVLPDDPTWSPFKLFTITDSVTLLADPWGLGDGRDVRTPGYIGSVSAGTSTNTGAAMHSEVARLFFFKDGLPSGAQDVLGAIQDIVSTLSGNAAGFGPLNAKVASFGYSDDASGPASASCTDTNPSLGCIDAFKENGAAEALDGSVHFFDTTQMRDRFGDPSPNVQAYQRRGSFYMGCPDSGTHDCQFK
jgi:hypothetical protein